MSEPLVTPQATGLAAGWYGKLPGLGDFATRRLPPEFVRRWDEWLQRGLRQAPAPGPGDALAATAPVRRFWLGAGVVDAQAWAGLLMPSADRSGRRFPLTVAQPMAGFAQALAARRWLTSLVAAMRFTLEHAHTLDDFEECLSALPPPPPKAAPRADEVLAQRVLQAQPACAACSVWWCHGATDSADFTVFDGLPPPAALAGLLEAPQ
jgi:type VI secretion system protein ImpM